MRQWEIFLFPFEREKAHPAVIISSDERCLNDQLDTVNALICTSAKVNRGPKNHEIILNGSDGLDWKTAVRCDLIYLLAKEDFLEKRGVVSPRRRVVIARKIVETLRFRMM